MYNYIRKTIGSGVYRNVYDIGYGYVLKVAKSEYGKRCNWKEVYLYGTAPCYVRRHLGKILDYHRNYSWIMMKRYRNQFPATRSYRRKLHRVSANLRKYGIYPFDVVTVAGKPKRKNLRINPNGKIVFIDYGNFRDRR